MAVCVCMCVVFLWRQRVPAKNHVLYTNDRMNSVELVTVNGKEFSCAESQWVLRSGYATNPPRSKCLYVEWRRCFLSSNSDYFTSANVFISYHVRILLKRS